MQKQPSRVGLPLHPPSSPLRARGRGQTAFTSRRGEERRAGSNGGSAWRERRYSLPLEHQSREISAKRYALDCQRRDQVRGRGRGRVSGGRVGGYQRHLPPRLLRQSRGETGEEELDEESLACQDVQAPQVKSIKLMHLLKLQFSVVHFCIV